MRFSISHLVVLTVIVDLASSESSAVSSSKVDAISLPTFSDVNCPGDHNAYSKCIEVDFQDGVESDVLLLNQNQLVPIIFSGHFRDEPNVKTIAILADEDNPNSNTVSNIRLCILAFVKSKLIVYC